MEVGDIKGRVDFGIITIRADEFRAVLRRFPEKLSDGLARSHRMYNVRTLALAGGDAYTIAILACVEQGNGEALGAARDLLEDLAPRWLLVVGIAGGMPAAEFTLGDVVVSTRIVDFSVEALLKDGTFEHAVTGGPVHHDVAIRVANLPAIEERRLDRELECSRSRSRLATRPAGRSLGRQVLWRRRKGVKKKNVRKSLQHHFGGASRAPPLVITAGAVAVERSARQRGGDEYRRGSGRRVSSLRSRWSPAVCTALPIPATCPSWPSAGSATSWATIGIPRGLSMLATARRRLRARSC